jgi:LacI family transcriptional regulator
MLVTLNDIALKAGVSITTVSRVLNHKHEKYRISTETKKRVLKAADELDYRPNLLARGLRLKRTHTIGIVVPDISNPFFSDITKAVESAAAQYGYSIILCNTDYNIEKEKKYMSILKSYNVDGILLVPTNSKDKYFKSLKNIKTRS